MSKLPIIRHARWLWLSILVEIHHEIVREAAGWPMSRRSDDAVLDAIWRGER
jgi:hypothetical protein